MTSAMSESQCDDALVRYADGNSSVPCCGEESSTMTNVRTGEGFPYDRSVHAELLSTKPNTKQSKGDVFNMTTVKELRVIAKDLKIKGYSAMTKETLANTIAAVIQASEPQASEHPLVNADNKIGEITNYTTIGDSDEDFFSGDGDHADDDIAADVVAYVKRIEYVKGTNLAVQFRWEGKLVIVGWSKADFKMHSWSEISGRSMLTSYATQMKFFKKLKNGLDGDVAQVVKALVRIKAMPAEIKVLQRKAARSDDQNVSGRRVDENGRIRRGVVDVNVMNVFVGMYAEAFDMPEADVRKKGMLIREFMNQYAALNDEVSIEEYAANYIGDLYYEMASNDSADDM